MNEFKATATLLAAPKLEYTSNGAAYADLFVAIKKDYDKQNEEWREFKGNVRLWRELAENTVGSSIPKGSLIELTCRLDTYPRSIFNENGEERSLSILTLTGVDVGVSLRYATVDVTRNEKRTDAAPAPRRASAGDDGDDFAAEAPAPRRSAPAPQVDDDVDEVVEAPAAKKPARRPAARKAPAMSGGPSEDENADMFS